MWLAEQHVEVVAGTGAEERQQGTSSTLAILGPWCLCCSHLLSALTCGGRAALQPGCSGDGGGGKGFPRGLTRVWGGRAGDFLWGMGSATQELVPWASWAGPSPPRLAQPSPPLADPSPSVFLQHLPLTPPDTSPATPGACPCPGLHHNLPCPEQNQEGHCYKGRESRPLSGHEGEICLGYCVFPCMCIV